MPYPSIFGLTPERLEHQLEALAKSACLLSMNDILDVVENGRPLPPRSAAVTFDDGLMEQYELAWPLLQKKGIPAIFFASTKPIDENTVTVTHKIHLLRAQTPPDRLLAVLGSIMEQEGIELDLPAEEKATAVYRYDTPEAARLKYFLNHMLDEKQQDLVIGRCFEALGFDEREISGKLYMTKDMTAELARAGVLGTHGHAHRPLGLIGNDEAVSDLDRSLTLLEQWTGCGMKALSYPFGFREACSEAVAGQARACGVRFAFTMERAANRDLETPLFLARFSTNDVFEDDGGTMRDGFWESVDYAEWYRR